MGRSPDGPRDGRRCFDQWAAAAPGKAEGKEGEKKEAKPAAAPKAKKHKKQ